MSKFSSIGFVGLGVMGEPMCHNLHRKSGLPVTVFDLDQAPLERAGAAGMAVADGLPALAAADIVFLSLPGGEQLQAVGDTLLGCMRKGQCLVDTTTAPVGLTRDLGARFVAAGIDYADAPIARTRQAARDGTLSVMVGADPDVYARIEPLIACYASDITHCGAVGTGQVVKLLNNMVVAETGQALAEALTIGRRSGIDPALLFDTLTKGSADSFVLRSHGMKAMLPGVFPLRAFSARYMLKDLSYALDLAADTNVVSPGAVTARDAILKTIDRGLGEAYWPALLAAVDEDLEPQTPTDD